MLIQNFLLKILKRFFALTSGTNEQSLSQPTMRLLRQVEILPAPNRIHVGVRKYPQP